MPVCRVLGVWGLQHLIKMLVLLMGMACIGFTSTVCLLTRPYLFPSPCGSCGSTTAPWFALPGQDKLCCLLSRPWEGVAQPFTATAI